MPSWWRPGLVSGRDIVSLSVRLSSGEDQVSYRAFFDAEPGEDQVSYRAVTLFL
jgi:hypothetical protein